MLFVLFCILSRSLNKKHLEKSTVKKLAVLTESDTYIFQLAYAFKTLDPDPQGPLNPDH